ncbi:cytochrome P450 family protein [Pseudonocardia sp. TRM90224]|uniref:cytochrome P450 family protein n=1 Tax=Pseudonocardia sp. TRM90224 TaxID=2812678 RepID=UPI001E533D53|nr:cytochrome P450 [Pseudonocardia sp. TRM90224]
MTATSIDIFEGAFWADPYPAYAALRADEPVREVQRPDGPLWLLSRYTDVRAALADPRLSKDWRYTLPEEQRAEAFHQQQIPMMLLMDPPGHTRLRKLVSRTFTLRRMEEMRPRVRQIAEELIEALPAEGKVDIMAEYAFLLPVFVICELLGVPADDRDEFAAWSNDMVDASSHEGSAQAMQNLHGYLAALIERKRAEPDDALISSLIEVADDGDRLSEAELVAMAMMLLIAGHETTVNLIGNGLLALMTHPEQMALLHERPELLPAAIEEFLRWDSPVHTTPARFAIEDVEYSGVTIPARSVVVLSLASANHDGDRFDAAAELRVDREGSGHVAFGHGLHHCLGAQLARIEGQEAIGLLIKRFPGLALDGDVAELVYRQSPLVRGLRTLPVTLA